MRKGFLIPVLTFAFAASIAAADELPSVKDKQDVPLIKDKQDTPIKGLDPAVRPKTETQPEPGPAPKTTEPGPAPKIIMDGSMPGFPSDGCWIDSCETANNCCGRCWASIEYLSWWITDGPCVPLVTTGNPNEGALAGALGSPGTRILFGGSDLNFDTFSGARLTLGGWLDCDRCCGIEISGFVLEQRSNDFSARSNNQGNPPLYLPAFNPVKDREDSLIVSDPQQRFGGSVSVKATSELWGAEVNGLFNCLSGCDFDLVGLVGVRHVELYETLQLNNTTNDLANDVTTSLFDRFTARNQFYGAQIGARLDWRHNCWTVGVTGKLAVGENHQIVNIVGGVTQFGTQAPTPGVFPGGFFTQPTNISHRTSDEFTVIPELDIKVGYQICNCVTAFIGYDIMYWNQTVRPGNQIDRSLNLSQSPVFGQGELAGVAQPQPQFNRSDFCRQGVSFGIAFKY